MQRHADHSDQLDKDFDGFLARSMESLVAKQEQFTRDFEGHKWSYNLNSAELQMKKLFRTTRLPIVAIGTYVYDASDWMWAWANDALPARTQEDATAVRSLYERTNYNIFNSATCQVSPQEVDELCAMAIEHLNARAVFKDRNNGTLICFAVAPTEHAAAHQRGSAAGASVPRR